MQFSLSKAKYKIVFITLLLSIMVFLSWITINTLTATVEDSSWDGVVATSFKSGTGTKENPYVISTAGELAYFRDLISGTSAESYIDKEYTITNSFNCGDYDFSINNTIPFTYILASANLLLFLKSFSRYLYTSLNGFIKYSIIIPSIITLPLCL